MVSRVWSLSEGFSIHVVEPPDMLVMVITHNEGGGLIIDTVTSLCDGRSTSYNASSVHAYTILLEIYSST